MNSGGPEYPEHLEPFVKAIRKAYPDIKIVGSSGPDSEGEQFDYLWPEMKKLGADLVDEHFYRPETWFLAQGNRYDNYDRKGPKVYLGEYAARQGKGNIDCALAEAVHLCNIERNADVVAMTSYAPLLSKNGHSNWSPDMIYFDNKGVDRTPSYETQRLFSTYSGNQYVVSTMAIDSVAGHRVATSVVRDSRTGQAFLKIANVLPVELTVTVDAKSLPIANVVRYEGYSGKPGQTRVSVERGTYTKSADGKLTVTLPPYAFRVVML